MKMNKLYKMSKVKNIRHAIILREEIYDDMGFIISDPNIEDGYDIMGRPVCIIVGAIIDGKIIKL